MEKPNLVSDEEIPEDEFSIYSKYNRETQLEDDELSPIEEAFMNGYDNAI
ncbi:MAG TPA: hypothetical protein VJI52_03980 [Candidatus Nanoarchaeia archaeon]|nr:hypothetical protein [Candidatus Nanoarchaeia archaeon]